MAQETQTGLCINLEGWDGEGEGKEVQREGYMYTYSWFMLRFDRKQQNSVKQLSFNKKIKRKKKLIFLSFIFSLLLDVFLLEIISGLLWKKAK